MNGDIMKEELRKINTELNALRKAILGSENGINPGLCERVRDNESRIEHMEAFAKYIKGLNISFILAMFGLALKIVFGK